ncbi:MAG: (Fe-S)-binding protein [Armatimonadota bacterium]|nr:(Fe-S)-binding protein [Armatimonadota bacterium]MDR7440094.1 (Fe-S)-binding protein [Armatimonadota bacterium]MDR7563582.1 (Fe-S)-binding protein [Armatimonadota bacterium]MDR7567808.1 (Fe-S)-binding protein [Armatimonadota bacterium]MDR7602194.1 (Fe-S)-binding protein [Armatimonadota bacterium]
MSTGLVREITFDDATWERLFRATGGTFAPCFSCGVCTAVCPWGLVGGGRLSIREVVRRVQLGLEPDPTDTLWRCTTCAACVAGCPRGVDIPEGMVRLRANAWREGRVPRNLHGVLWAIHWDGNPYRRPPTHRARWAKDLDVPEFTPDHEVLYYVGCTPSYDRRLQKVARSLVEILRRSGVSFGTLGDQERCCGESVYVLGHDAYLRRYVEEHARMLAEAGVRALVTISPHCFDMFRRFYPDLRGDFRPLHYTQYLAGLLEEGRLRFTRELRVRATYHDPCYLGRRHGIYEEPRRLLQAIPGVELVEMRDHREESLCCGGGGGRMWMETPAEERFSNLRVQQALETNAEVLVTACPHCIACLEDSLKVLGVQGLRVMDVAELVAQAL